MKETFIQQCLDILKRDDIKHELRALYAPMVDLILYEVNPYIYVTIVLVFLIFIMILAILILLILVLRNKSLIQKIF
jgi:hypothetical protein|uniref:Uncharacterized protein n=1 Tax=viral metagenome TaxID=1070528 RepID=A0A6C0EZH8_9ZZZZ